MPEGEHVPVVVAVSVEEGTGDDDRAGWAVSLNRLDKYLVVFNYLRHSCTILDIVYAQMNIYKLRLSPLHFV